MTSLTRLPTSTLAIDQSNLSLGFLHFQQVKTVTWLWRWLLHGMSPSVANNIPSQDSNHPDGLFQSRYSPLYKLTQPTIPLFFPTMGQRSKRQLKLFKLSTAAKFKFQISTPQFINPILIPTRSLPNDNEKFLNLRFQPQRKQPRVNLSFVASNSTAFLLVHF